MLSFYRLIILYASRLRVQEEAHALDRRRRVDFSEGLELIVLNRSFPQMPVPSNADQRKRVAACVFDVNQAVDYIAESVLAIRSSVQTCPDKTLGAACSTTVNGALEALLWAATAVAAAATDCAKTQNAKAVCATDSLCIAANLAEIASAGSGVRAACVLGEDSQFDLQLTEDAENRQAQLAACVFEAMHATAYLGAAGIIISNSAENCKAGATDATACAVDILNLIATFNWVAAYFSLVANDCPLRNSVPAACASNIANLIAGITSLASCGIATGKDCSG
eukprot:TRINITY_DN19007_c0_g1_i2.p1 TRINITY_DN19007_c0_g1~~TRINITY_DN19007_c0_g1_i2.p1  ORF type:complete len:281 (-),score=30.99 TRINITY_DN19007_c0_g1_i2:645-1487(-)